MYQTTITNIANKISEKDIESLYNTYFKELFPQVRKTIKERWLRGKTPDGGRIGAYKVVNYALFKKEKNPLAGFYMVDSTLTGSLGNKITFLMLSESEYEIFSTDEKYNDIVEEYGDYNFNLREDEKTEISKQLTNKTILEIIKKSYYE